MKTITVPQLAWYGPRELELTFPDSWDIEVCNIAGCNRPALSDEQIKNAITNPIGTSTIKELARGKKEVVILFDDLTSGTRPARIVLFVLQELAEAGIPDSNIRFICALGAHAPMNRIDFAKKLGEDVLARYAVYNHNVFDNCTYVGTTSYGTKVSINTEVMHCDLKIAIASMTPHPFAVFGGGGKIVLPGVSSMETILANHIMPLTDEERASYDINPRRLDMEEAASFANLDVLIECIINMWGETVSLYAGAPTPVREAAIKDAKAHYLAPKAEGKDIVIVNTYIKASEAAVDMRHGIASVSQNGGDIVLIANAPGGQVGHYLIGSWGKMAQGEFRKFRLPIPGLQIASHINHLILYNEYPDMAGLGRFRSSNKVLSMSSWDNVLPILSESHGDNAEVAVYPSADIQYFG